MDKQRGALRWFLVPLLVLAVAAVFAACGSDDDDSGGDTAAAADDGGSGDAGGEATGDPLKIFLLYPASDNQVADFPGVKLGAEAAVKAINNEGGVKGRPLDLGICDHASDQAKALKCAREAIDAEPIALVGQTDLFSDQTLPMFEKAGIASIGPYSHGNKADATSKVSFPLGGGVIQGYIGTERAIKDLGMTSLAASHCEYPSCKENAAALEKYAKSAGVEFKGKVEVPNTGITDYSPYAAKLKGLKADAVALITSPGPQIGVMKAAKAIGYEPTYVGTAQLTGEKQVSAPAVKDLYDGMVAGSQAPSPRSQDDPTMKRYVKESAESEGVTPEQWLKEPMDQSWANQFNAWLSVYAFKAAAEMIDGEIRTDSMLGFLSKQTEPIDLLGFQNWTPGATGPADFPRYSNMKTWAVRFNDGEMTTIADVKPFELTDIIK